MDFKLVFDRLLTFFHENNVRYALIGGFALALHGVSRSTVDIDFLVHRDDLSKIDTIMKELGYNCIYRSEDVSQFTSPLKVFGEVDFIHAFRDISVEMLERVEQKGIFHDAILIKVLRVEDLIAFKVQAIANDESRKALDLNDVMLREDMRYLAEHRHNPFLKDGHVDIDNYIEFLNTFNEFINHNPKPFKPMIDKVMKL
jgi:hypothetical protein